MQEVSHPIIICPPPNTSPKHPKTHCLCGFQMVRCSHNTSPHISPHTPPSGDGRRRHFPASQQHIGGYDWRWMVGDLVRSLVRCFFITSPSERPINRAIQRILVRCCPIFSKNFSVSADYLPGIASTRVADASWARRRCLLNLSKTIPEQVRDGFRACQRPSLTMSLTISIELEIVISTEYRRKGGTASKQRCPRRRNLSRSHQQTG